MSAHQGLLAQVRVRGATAFSGTLGLMSIAVVLLPGSVHRVLLRQDAAADAGYLVSTIAAVGLGAGLFPGLAEVERLCRRPRSPHRAAWLLSQSLAVVSCLLALDHVRRTLPLEINLRNYLLSAGLSLIASVLLPKTFVWAPATFLVACTWMFGTTDLSATPRRWALLFAQPDLATWALCGAVFGCGAGLWIRFDGRIDPG